MSQKHYSLRQTASNFEKTLKTSHDNIYASIKTRKSIFESIPKTTQNPNLRALSAPIRIYCWFRASKKITALWAAVLNHDHHVKLVQQALNKLYNLPVETADQIKSTHALLKKTMVILDELLGENVHGEKIKRAELDAQKAKNILSQVLDIFYSLPPERLVIYPEIKRQTQIAYRIFLPAKIITIKLNKDVEEWRSALRLLKLLVNKIQSRMDDADLKIAFLDDHLSISSAKEEFSKLSQEALQLRDTLKSPSVEGLGSALTSSNQTLKLFENLLEVLKNYEKRISVLYKAIEQATKDIDFIDTEIQGAASRAEYPIVWTNTQKLFEELKRNFEKIPPISQKRSVEELQESLSLVAECDKLLKQLFQLTSKANTNLKQTIELWNQIPLVYKKEDLQKIKELYSQTIVYDVNNNWDPSDKVKEFWSDATRLWNIASSNVPTSKSIPVYEQLIPSLLTTAKDLIRQKPLFDQRQKNIQSRLDKIRKDEQEAIIICQRSYQPLTQFANELRSMDKYSPVTVKIVEFETSGLEHLQSLQQRNNGKVEGKLEKIRRWEKEAIENAKAVNTFIERDVESCKKELAKQLKETTFFAEGLEDEIVLQAREIAMVFNKHQLVVDGVRQVKMGDLQKYASSLLRQRQSVIVYYNALVKFLKPVKDEYQQISDIYNAIKSEVRILGGAERLGRKWPPVFRSLKNIEDRLNAFAQEVNNIRTRCRKKDRLLMEYGALRPELRSIKNEINKIIEMDQSDINSILSLQENYLKLAVEYAAKIFKEDEINKRSMIQSANNHVYDFLPKAYYSGVKEKDGRIVRWDPAKIKSHLEDLISEKRKQIINFNNVNARDINIDQTMKS